MISNKPPLYNALQCLDLNITFGTSILIGSSEPLKIMVTSSSSHLFCGDRFQTWPRSSSQPEAVEEKGGREEEEGKKSKPASLKQKGEKGGREEEKGNF